MKWEGFGEQLPEIHTHDINIIKRENPGDIEGQKRELFGKWLRVYPDASWRHVYKALTDAGENKLANEIREKYLPHIHVPEEKATVDVKKGNSNCVGLWATTPPFHCYHDYSLLMYVTYL